MARLLVLVALLWPTSALAQEFDLLLKGGHVIDARNSLSAVRDVALKDGRVASVAANIAATRATKTIDVAGLYAVPGLIDLHAHVYRPTVSLESGVGQAIEWYARHLDAMTGKSVPTTA